MEVSEVAKCVMRFDADHRPAQRQHIAVLTRHHEWRLMFWDEVLDTHAVIDGQYIRWFPMPEIAELSL